MFKKAKPDRRKEGGIPAGVPENRDDALFEALDKTKKAKKRRIIRRIVIIALVIGCGIDCRCQHPAAAGAQTVRVLL